MNCYSFIEAEGAGSRNVKRACALLKVSRVAFYAHRSGPSRREQEDAELTARIQAVHEGSKAAMALPGFMPGCSVGAVGTPQAGGPADTHRAARSSNVANADRQLDAARPAQVMQACL